MVLRFGGLPVRPVSRPRGSPLVAANGGEKATILVSDRSDPGAWAGAVVDAWTLGRAGVQRVKPTNREERAMRSVLPTLVPRTRSSHQIAAGTVADFGFKSGTRIIDLL